MFIWSKVDPKAKPSSTPAFPQNSSFANASELKNDVDEPTTWMNPCEMNQTFLDVVQASYPQSPHYPGVYSTIAAGKDGVFITPPTLTVTFSQTINSDGVTLYFSEVYAKSVIVNFYNGTSLLASKTFQPDSLVYFCNMGVLDYTKAEISFASTLPEQRIKLWRVEWGQIKNITLKEITNASLIENVNECSTKVVIDTVDLKFLATAENFNIVTSPGEYGLIKERQPVKSTQGYGTFFISSFDAVLHNVSLSLVDLLGAIENVEILGGFYDTTLGTFVSNIAAICKTADIFGQRHNGFQIDADVASLPIKGYLPITTARTALQYAAIATQTVIDKTRNDRIRFRSKATTKTADIPDGKIEIGDKTGSNDFYTTVTVLAYTYTLNTANNKSKVVDEVRPIGEHLLRLDSPYAQYEITGGSIISSDANWIKYNSNGGQVTILAYPYTENVSSVTVNKSKFNVEKIFRCEKNSLITPANAPTVAAGYLDYYGKVYKSEFKSIGVEKTGEIYKANDVTGIVERQKIDLTTELSEVIIIGNYVNN